ncbi:MAG: hypothetical protein IID44_17000 [Planctomycetes bacterium]|nr:hypothetical protein [Planctomycetota bacterium]
MRKMFACRSILFALAAVLIAAPLSAQTGETDAAARVVSSNLQSPQATMRTLLTSVDSDDLATAVECLDWSAIKVELTTSQKEGTAQRRLAVFGRDRALSACGSGWSFSSWSRPSR